MNHRTLLPLVCLAFVAVLGSLRADVVETKNGARIVGHVTKIAGAGGALQVIGAAGTITTTVDKVAVSWPASGKDPAVIALEQLGLRGDHRCRWQVRQQEPARHLRRPARHTGRHQ